MGGRETTVLFAGVCDATLDAVAACLAQLREATVAAGGRVIKTIGEDLMALFPSPDAAAAAAAAMQKAMEAMPEGTSRPGVRVGFHSGPVINRDGDVFGDTVNLAARLAQQAIREQIITDAGTAANLSEHYKACLRRLYAVELKGKAEQVDLCEVVWRVGSGTDTFTFEAGLKAAVRAKAVVLRLVHKGQEIQRRRDADSFAIGRDAECDLPITHHLISRRHCSIEKRGDKFVLADQSSNGTFVTIEGDSEFVVHREEFILRKSGCISFGQSRETSEHFIEFYLD
jgi:adenylate cyclase